MKHYDDAIACFLANKPMVIDDISSRSHKTAASQLRESSQLAV